MKKFCITSMALVMSMGAFAQSGQPAKTVPVSPDNFNQAESDMYFAESIKLSGGLAKFHHNRDVMDVNKQTVVRANRDTVYSTVIVDLDAGPATIVLPEAGKRFMSVEFFSEDQYATSVHYGAGKYTVTKDEAGTRYAMAGIRLFVDPTDPNDLKKVHELQDAIKLEQAGKGSFETPNWDQASRKKVHDALVVLASTLPDTKRMFGPKNEVDPVRHLIGTATGWGGNPEKDAMYLTVTPPKNDGKTVYKLTVKDVPIEGNGFWSISMYNTKGYFQPNKLNAYAINNLSAKRNADGSVTVQFGGCDGKVPNCLPTTPGWNYWVRLYRPSQSILDGKWTFPEPEEVH